jgi:hypothetical protein
MCCDRRDLDLVTALVVIFDFLTVHRGGVNASEFDRPVYYTVCGIPEWRDTLNWRAETASFRNFESNFE